MNKDLYFVFNKLEFAAAGYARQEGRDSGPPAVVCLVDRGKQQRPSSSIAVVEASRNEAVTAHVMFSR